MTDDAPLMCCACHERKALPGSFCCLACCPEPEPEPLDCWQPVLLEAA